MATKIRAGTSGYSYKAWRGSFYPDDLPPDEWLSYYARQLPSVEINNTFYRMPKEYIVAAWRDAVPAHFRFVIKASRRISHQHRLKNAEEATGYLVQRALILGEKLGAVLIQLPPNMPSDLDRLQAFFDLLPQDLPCAFEFRHESWLDDGVDEVLRARGHALVLSHDNDNGPTDIPAGPLVYLRLRAPDHSAIDLKKWHARVLASGAENAFVFFKHEDDGAGPAMARRFLDIQSQARPQSAKRAATRAVTSAKPSPKAAPARRTSAKRKDTHKVVVAKRELPRS